MYIMHEKFPIDDCVQEGRSKPNQTRLRELRHSEAPPSATRYKTPCIIAITINACHIPQSSANQTLYPTAPAHAPPRPKPPPKPHHTKHPPIYLAMQQQLHHRCSWMQRPTAGGVQLLQRRSICRSGGGNCNTQRCRAVEQAAPVSAVPADISITVR